MKIPFFLFILFISSLSCSSAQKNGTASDPVNNKPDSLATPGVTEYLSIYGPFKVGDYVFHLRWSDHSQETVYIQDYVPTIYDHDMYIQLLRVTLQLDNTKPKEALNAKIKELEIRKAKDPLLKYNVSMDPRTGDDVLEYLLTRTENGDNTVAEWNFIRYAPYKSPSGKKGLEIFTYSRRGYGMKIDPFLGDVERHGKEFINNFLAIPMPVIEIK